MQATRPAGPDPAALAEATQSAADQVRHCYQNPRISRAGRQIVTKLHVRYAPDGTIAEMPLVLSQSGVTPANQAYAGTMAAAAIASVLRCPLKLPPELYAMGWEEFELTFSPKAMG